MECNALQCSVRRIQAGEGELKRPGLVALRFVDGMIDTTIYPRVDGSMDIELPQQSTLHRDDEHRVKGPLGTNLVEGRKREFLPPE